MTESVVDNAAMAAEATPGPVVFNARRWRLVRVLIKNLLLGLVTLGIYRFWAKTNVRGYFWRHVSIAGERLEFTGRGRVLLIGFLIVLAVLVPVVGVYQVLAFALGTAGPGANLVLQLVLVLTLAFLVQVSVFRMLRYRLTRTIWRGIRFGLDGSALRYAVMAFEYWLLVALTLGIAYPWMRVALSRYLINRMQFGNRHFEFDARAIHLLRYWIPAAVLGVAVVILLGWFFFRFTVVHVHFGFRADSHGTPAQQLLALVPILLAAFAALVTLFTLYTRYRMGEFRYFARCTSIGETGFSSSLRTGPVLGLYVVYLALLLAGLFLVSLVFGLFVASTGMNVNDTQPAIVVILIVLWFGFSSIFRTAWLRFGLVERISHSLSITNLAAVEAVIQSSQEMPRHGEGLADALDVGDF